MKNSDAPIRDARQLGIPKMLILGLQHMFAMFGATVLVPLLTGLDISTTLLWAGLGTLLFHLITGFKVPAFLGSSFAFLGGYAYITSLTGAYNMTEKELLPYACLGVAAAGLVYLVFALLIKIVGIKRIMKFFPPVVTGPIIIAIGLCLAYSAINNYMTNWVIATIALLVVIIFNIWGKGMAKIIPIVLGVVIAYIIGVSLDICAGIWPELGEKIPVLFSGNIIDFQPVKDVCNNIANGEIIGNLVDVPMKKDATIFAIDWSNTSLIVTSIVAIVPISLATMMEHIGDISAISSTCGDNFIKNPGLHRSLTGDGLATTLASVCGAPANTTYGENTGVLALTKVYDPKVVRIAAFFAVGISFFPIVSACIKTIPSAIIGGISFVLYGMISAVGVRNVVESKVDFTKSRNLIIAAVILVCALGFNNRVTNTAITVDGVEYKYVVNGLVFEVAGVSITLTGLAIAAIAGILLNAILPGKDYTFTNDENKDTDVICVPDQNAESVSENNDTVVEAEDVDAAEEAVIEETEEAVEAVEATEETVAAVEANAEEIAETTEEAAEATEEAVEATEVN